MLNYTFTICLLEWIMSLGCMHAIMKRIWMLKSERIIQGQSLKEVEAS